MQPIISPWLIYLLGVINPILNGLIALAVISGVFFIVSFCAYYICKYDDDVDESWVPFWKKCRNTVLPFFIIFTFLAMFTPNRNTIIGIVVAKNITSNNVNKALEAGQDFKEEIKKDIFELIEAIQDKKEEK